MKYEREIYKHRVCWHLDLRFPASRTVRNKYLFNNVLLPVKTAEQETTLLVSSHEYIKIKALVNHLKISLRELIYLMI